MPYWYHIVSPDCVYHVNTNIGSMTAYTVRDTTYTIRLPQVRVAPRTLLPRVHVLLGV